MRIGHFFVLVLLLAVVAIAEAYSQDNRDKPCEPLPTVLEHAAPIYPPLARQTRISGDVRLKILTDGEAVTQVEVESGHPLLRQAALDNVRTWKFALHPPGTFEVTFRFKLLSAQPEIEFLECPGIVTLELSPSEVIINYATLGLGTWKAEFNTPSSKFSGTLKLFASGPKGEWLDAELTTGKGPKVETDYGYLEGNFLTFSFKLTQHDGKRVKTFFVGKMAKDEIVGTFVDDAGTTGEWTAVKTAR